jgi:hypothetical protein
MFGSDFGSPRRLRNEYMPILRSRFTFGFTIQKVPISFRMKNRQKFRVIALTRKTQSATRGTWLEEFTSKNPFTFLRLKLEKISYPVVIRRDREGPELEGIVVAFE